MADIGNDLRPHAIDAAFVARLHSWSEETFGPGLRTKSTVEHIRKELIEILDAPGDVEEWVDVLLLALSGACRSGADAQTVIDTLFAKQTKNEQRMWPDWRSAEPGKAIEHVRNSE